MKHLFATSCHFAFKWDSVWLIISQKSSKMWCNYQQILSCYQLCACHVGGHVSVMFYDSVTLHNNQITHPHDIYQDDLDDEHDIYHDVSDQ